MALDGKELEGDCGLTVDRCPQPLSESKRENASIVSMQDEGLVPNEHMPLLACLLRAQAVETSQKTVQKRMWPQKCQSSLALCRNLEVDVGLVFWLASINPACGKNLKTS
jgi:hypothetical protein